jgi:hypothetical protein
MSLNKLQSSQSNPSTEIFKQNNDAIGSQYIFLERE